MKFPQMTVQNIKEEHIEALKGGLCTDTENAENNDSLSACLNVWYSGGELKTRPALKTDASKQLFDGQYGRGNSYSCQTTDIKITAEGEIKNMVLETIDYDVATYFFRTHFINPDGSVWKTAQIIFQRVQSETFYHPERWVFYKGKPQNGCGVFLLANTVNIENRNQTHTRFFELSSDYGSWESVSATYIPTVYINGRGNNYELASATNQAFEGTPKRLEDLNALNGEFYAYYSTDGYSSVYRLPITHLDDDTVSCRLYYSASEYVSWVVDSGQTSASTVYHGVEVTMHVNREKGIVNFTVPAGDFEMPLITDRNENNLRFCACKSNPYIKGDVAKCGVSVTADKKILLAGGSTVFEADYEKPLYFPVGSMLTVGDGNAPITALTAVKGKILAFKEESTFELTVKKGSRINSISLLADDDAVFYDSDMLEQKCISYNVGCPYKESVIRLNRKLFWRGQNGRFYKADLGGEIQCITENINSYIDANFSLASKCVGTSYENAVIFFLEAGALVMTEENGWYYWELPENIQIKGCFSTKTHPIMICYNFEDKIHFLSSFGVGNDILLEGSVYDPQEMEYSPKSFIKTVGLSLGCRNVSKNISAVKLGLKAGKAKIYINDRLEARILPSENPNEHRTVMLAPGICTSPNLSIAIESECPIAVGSIDIKYTLLKI